MIFGILSLDGGSPPQEWVVLMEARARVWPSAHQMTHASKNAYLASNPVRQRGHADRAPNSLAQIQGTVVLFDGRLDNVEELRSSLSPCDGIQDSLLVNAWRQWNLRLPASLIGDFAMAVVEGENRLLLARDPFGVRPLFFARSGSWVAFASSMDVLLPLPFVDRTPNTSWMADFVEGIKADGTATPYRGIMAVSAGTQVSFEPGGMETRRHWNPPALDDFLDIDPNEAAEEFCRLFDQAIVARLPDRGPAAFEMSGGLDSTSIAVSAAPLMVERGQRMLTLSHVLGRDAGNQGRLRDERPQIEAVLGVLPPGEHRWLDNSHQPQVASMADMIVRHGGPVRRDFNSVQHGLVEALREHGCDVLFSGFGGDDIVTGAGAGLLESLAQDRRWDELDRLISHPLARLAWRNAVGRHFLRSRAHRRRSDQALAKPGLTGTQYLSDVELAQRRMRFPLVPAWGTIGARERWRATAPAIGIRGQDSAVGAGSQGFEYVYPMLDVRLVEFVLRLPDRLKRTVEGRRCMIRRAMAGRLPDMVRLRDDKSPSAVPVAAARFHLEHQDYLALFKRNLENPLLTQVLDMQKALDELRTFQDSQGSNGTFSLRHFRAIAQLCLWSEQEFHDQPYQAE